MAATKRKAMTAQDRPSDRSRARKAKAKPDRVPKVERIKRIRLRIRDGTWEPGMSEDDFARQCGVSRRHIELDAGEAQRRMAETREDDEEIRAMVRAAIRGCTAKGHELYEAAMKRGQLRTAIEAKRMQLESLKLFISAEGVEPAKKLDIGGNLGELLGLAQQDPEPDGGGSAPTE